MQCATWCVLRLKRPLQRNHMLVLDRYTDLRLLFFQHWEMFEFVVFAFDTTTEMVDRNYYMVQIVKCADDMRDIRQNIKLAYKTSALGHTYVINERIPMYAFLKEWYVQNYLEIYQLKLDTYIWEIPHVIVFDLDSTLITDEEHVRIRDDAIYDSLLDLKRMGCVLVLWSYGNKEHVSHSMRVVNLENYFDVVLCKGYKTGQNQSNVSVDVKKNIVFVEKTFYLDVEDGDRLPKSPRIVLWHLRKLGVNYIKSITLVDDLKINNYAYDYFVHVKKCPHPRVDWNQYHDTIVNNIEHYDNVFK
ncbi:38 kDa protein [Buzura suppressaria nucleopolyhedrovirus]|uniref:38 kDa protein n=1 Tax=Buzura suppressaria nuclear polyhedrosis virus TaxID=74320 RepID=W5VKQ2_NPVBS|nr:38 kDa protein [Buzura suppressaria nucleopolyhedrovirus]AHH82663.1 38 kDa protein [Buzura suppressaria nucleopolyhedrovirus]AKN91046.1 38K [Buzura suppressaria nucleopolyhedrovirus]